MWSRVPAPIKKIEAHWAHTLQAQGKNPLKHALRCHRSWYLLHMPNDPEIDQYFNEIDHSEQKAKVLERLQNLELLEQWIIREKEDLSRQLDS